MGSYFFFFPMILLLAATCYGQGFYNYNYNSRATSYSSPDGAGTAYGSCGYGTFGKNVNNGEVTAVSKLYRNGGGCGACYQVKCKIQRECSEEGVKVLVTDYRAGGRADFIMSERAYEKLARPNMAAELSANGVVDVEYRRVQCGHGRNLELRIHETSRYPSYLAMVPIFSEGISDITGIDIGVVNHDEWRPMRRAFGTVFGITNPPMGSLRARVHYANPDQVRTSQLTFAIPRNWKVGVAYDTASQHN
ncbi:unnamed protein product [Fraxinus pennsylvanica]|uniref:Expansin-like B1 n=1 Tax=Fraxinus pennsylvanica TaxID=56036 RepID=A0AAD2DLY6_9LAMI|nr:unnamed protein product [Fraxinus pennsylvanica]